MPVNRRTFLSGGLATIAAARLLRGQMASRGVRPSARPRFSGRPFPVTFTDISARAGLRDAVPYGGMEVKKYVFEANGSGIAFFDYDNDGWLDIFVLGGSTLEGQSGGARGTNRLYKNNRNGTFTDVTQKAGLVREGWGYGVCVGDYDNDGNDDLFLTYYGANVLYHNNGDGTFSDATAAAGLRQAGTRFSSGCTFVDYDRDGHLDLFVSHYIDFDIKRVPTASTKCKFLGIPIACGPSGLPLEQCSLYHNNGNGTFTEVTKKAGLLTGEGRYGLGAIALDYDNDGWPDLFVACDSTANLLYRNNRDGTFRELAMDLGVAVNGDGHEQANMGIAVGDYNGDGYLDLFLPHFVDDTPILYRNGRGKYFDDVTEYAGLAVNTKYVCWGTGFADFDNDGWIDLLQVNGSVYPEVQKPRPDYPFQQQRVVYRNLGNGMFEEVSDLCGAPILEAHSSRGCAFGDFNNDGRVDVLIMNQGEPPSLLRCEVQNDNHWLVLKAVGTKSNKSAIGARIEVTAGGRKQIREVMSGASYLSQNDLRQHFGLGGAAKIDSVEVRWPNGDVERCPGVEADRFVTIHEGKGVVDSRRH